MKTRLVPVSLAAVLLIGCLSVEPIPEPGSGASLHAPTPDERTEISIPFELLPSGHMAIMVRLNGKGPYRMIFDTGSPGVQISPRVAKECGWLKDDAEADFLGDFETPPDSVRVQVGDFQADGLVAEIGEHPTVKALAAVEGPLEGLLGFDLFNADAVSVDYQSRTIKVLPARETKMYDSRHQTEFVINLLKGRTDPLAPMAMWGMQVDKQTDDTNPGVNVVQVTDGTPAAAAGLRAGDRLLELSRRWTDSVEDVYRAAGTIAACRRATVLIRRGDQEMSLDVRPVAGI